MTTAELRAVRQRIYTEFLCPVDEHAWSKVYAGEMVLFVICMTCGRTPLEMLSQLPVLPAELAT